MRCSSYCATLAAAAFAMLAGACGPRAALPALPSSIAQTIVEGNDPPDQSFTLTNATPSNCALNWSMHAHTADGVNWLSASTPADDTTGLLETGASVEIRVRMRATAPNNLPPGTYSGSIVLDGTCVQNDRRARGAPHTVEVNLRVRPKPGSVTVRWLVGGQPASMASCPAGSTVEIRLPNADNATYVPCATGEATFADAPLGLGPVFVALRDENPDAPDLSALDVPYVLRPDGSALAEVSLFTAVPDTDGILRATDALACRTTRENLLGNGGFESVPALEGNYIAGMLPLGWESVGSAPFVVDQDGVFGVLPDAFSGHDGLPAQSGRRFVSVLGTSAGYAGEAFTQRLAAPLTAGRHYRIRAFLQRSSNTTAYPGSGAFSAYLTNDDRSRIRHVGRFVPVAGVGWQSRSFAFQAPANAADYTRLELRGHTRFADAPSRTGIDGVALQDITGCTRARLPVSWMVGGLHPRDACPPGSKVRLRVPAAGAVLAQVRIVDCATGLADWRDLEPGAPNAFVDLLAADGTTVLDTQELFADLRAANDLLGVRRVDLWAIAREPDGTPAAATSPACEGAPELLVNGGFEEAPRNDRGALPTGWAFAPTTGSYTTLWSIDMGVGAFPGNYFEDDFIGATPGEGTSFVSQWRISNMVAQPLTTPLVAGAAYRVRGLVRNGSAEQSSPDPGGYAFFITNAAGDAGSVLRARLLPPNGTGAEGERWQVRSAVFVAPADAAQFTHFAFRGANLYSATGSDLGPRNAGPGLDALSLTRVDVCATQGLGGRVRLTWSLGGPEASSACQAGDEVKVSIEGGALVSVPCTRGVSEIAVGTARRPHVYAEWVRGGEVVAALEREIEVAPYGVSRVHFAFQRSVTGYDGTPCAVESRACFGKPVELLGNGSFEEMPEGSSYLSDFSVQPVGWETIGGAYTYHLDDVLGGAMEGLASSSGVGGYAQVRPVDGLRFRNFYGGPYIDPETGESNGTKVMRPVLLLEAGRRYRVRAFIRRASPVGSNVGRGVSLRVRFGPDNAPLPRVEDMNLRSDAGRFCPVSSNEWESRSITFTAPTGGPYVYFDAYTDDENGQSFALDHVSMTDVTNCAP
jgi:hypothetical protein